MHSCTLHEWTWLESARVTLIHVYIHNTLCVSIAVSLTVVECISIRCHTHTHTHTLYHLCLHAHTIDRQWTHSKILGEKIECIQSVIVRQHGRVVKAPDSKSGGLCPRGFESPCCRASSDTYAWMAEWSKAVDLSSILVRGVGSNPTSGTFLSSTNSWADLA